MAAWLLRAQYHSHAARTACRHRRRWTARRAVSTNVQHVAVRGPGAGGRASGGRDRRLPGQRDGDHRPHRTHDSARALSTRGRRPVPAAAARPDRHAHRDDRSRSRRRRSTHREGTAGPENVTVSTGFIGVQPPELPDQHHLPLDGRSARSRASRSASSERRTSARRRAARNASAPCCASGCPTCASPSSRPTSWPGDELRLARRRSRSRCRGRTSPPTARMPRRSTRELAKIPDAARPAVRAGARLPDAAHRRRSRPRRTGRPVRQRRRPIAGGRHLVEPLRRAELLARSRRAAIAFQIQVEIPQHADGVRGRRPRPAGLVARPSGRAARRRGVGQRGPSARAWSSATTCSAW